MTRSYLSIDEHSTITNYSVASKGARAVVKLEIVVTDAEELAWLVREISKAQAESKPAKPKQKQQPLALPYYGGSS
ncbi:MAG: hypothetical protein EOS63_17350 [Mesorhizobium sp.]|uniref:hypothetical protein n=1 Tax=Mesorhizobium sp. TaxID=1871066 RepID=UPI000FE9E58B|nr:hypothetical protein [Mesorhizobium sp.]RWE78522.1 MAG: hypothetical protein EOS63_17350 [Mesorhizobium sp.]TJW61028.1 MAG: hypothetical protein E5V97_22195 [Mesorhizobium sp.]